jgi:transketolase
MCEQKTIEELKRKSDWVRKETIRLHGKSPETRLASSLSAVEILTVLFYAGKLKFDPSNPDWEGRDRFIVSKGHGSISLYPILADLGFFSKEELEIIGKKESFLGSIPDPVIPGYETVNGSLGHGPGVGAGMALGLKVRKSDSKVVVMVGDGEIYEGAVWEALMFAGHHNLNNLTMILDHNKISMLNYCEEIISHGEIESRFAAFGWDTYRVDGHNIEAVSEVFDKMFSSNSAKPKILIADTVKGKGVTELENDHLCHIKSLKTDRVEELLGGDGK